MCAACRISRLWNFHSLISKWSELGTEPRQMGLHGLARNSSKLVTSRQSEPLRAHAVFRKGLQSPSFSKRSVQRRCTTRGIYTMAGKQPHTCNWHCHPLRGLVCALGTSRQWEFSHCGSHEGMVSTELSQQMRQNGSARNSSKVVTSSQST